MLTAETETESLPSITSHTHTLFCPAPLFCLCAAHAPLLPLLVWPHILSVSDRLCLITEDSQTARGSATDSRKRRGMRNWGGGRAAGRAKTRREGDLEEERETLRDRLQREREDRQGKRSLGKRLGTKTQGNWETKSEPGINREEEKERDERREGGEGLERCEARIAQPYVTSYRGAE